jgi:uncharacterized membrane protein
VRLLRTALTVLIGITIVAYPPAVYFGLKTLQPKFVGLLILAIFALRVILTLSLKKKSLQQLLPVLIAVLVIVMLTLISNDPLYLRAIPVLINATLFGLFLYTVIHPPSMIERIARLSHPDLPESGQRYTRKVTKVWMVFFVANGFAALYTVFFASLEIWTLYNGFVSYILMGIIFAVEFFVRPKKSKAI